MCLIAWKWFLQSKKITTVAELTEVSENCLHTYLQTLNPPKKRPKPVNAENEKDHTMKQQQIKQQLSQKQEDDEAKEDDEKSTESVESPENESPFQQICKTHKTALQQAVIIDNMSLFGKP